MSKIVYRSFIYEAITPEVVTESLEISLSKKAWNGLSDDAKEAISSWERSQWINGPLEQHIKNNDSVAHELRIAMKPILDSIKGDTVTLYRGTSKETLDEKRFLQSWTSSEKVARHFAGFSSSQTKDRPTSYKTHSPEEIEQAVKYFNEKGFVKFDNKYYVVNKEDPSYYSIYDRDRNYLTDGDDLLDSLTSDNNDKIESNDRRLKNKIVLKKTFDKNRIIWITNNLNSKEYIVRVD